MRTESRPRVSDWYNIPVYHVRWRKRMKAGFMESTTYRDRLQAVRLYEEKEAAGLEPVLVESWIAGV